MYKREHKDGSIPSLTDWLSGNDRSVMRRHLPVL